MKIIFYSKECGTVLKDTEWLFVMDNEVYSDNGNDYESHPEILTFEDFIMPMNNIGWKVEDK